MYGFTCFLLVATILILCRHAYAVCPCNRVLVSGVTNDATLQINGAYYLMPGVTCDDELVFKSEALTANRYIYADSRDKNWAIGPKCDRKDTKQYIQSPEKGTWPTLCPVDIPQGIWMELSGGTHVTNAGITIVCDTVNNPQQYPNSPCPTYEFNLTGAAAALEVNGQYMINIYEDEPICDKTNQRYVWKRVFPATPVRYVYWDERGTRWAASDRICHNDGKRQFLVSYGAPDNWEETVVWEEQTTLGSDKAYSVNMNIKLGCMTPECKQWSALTSLTPGVCVRQNCMTKPGATEALCHAPCGGCGKEFKNRTCEVGLRQPGGIYGNVETLTERCNVVPCNGAIFSEKYEFIKYKFNAYGRWARAYMLRKCCVNFNNNNAELAKRAYCSNVGGLV